MKLHLLLGGPCAENVDPWYISLDPKQSCRGGDVDVLGIHVHVHLCVRIICLCGWRIGPSVTPSAGRGSCCELSNGHLVWGLVREGLHSSFTSLSLSISSCLCFRFSSAVAPEIWIVANASCLSCHWSSTLVTHAGLDNFRLVTNLVVSGHCTRASFSCSSVESRARKTLTWSEIRMPCEPLIFALNCDFNIPWAQGVSNRPSSWLGKK